MTADEKKKPAEGQRRDVAALEAILDEEPEVFCNIVGVPCIKIPFERGNSDGVVCPLRSDQVRACIAVFVWEKVGLVLFEQEVTRLLTVLEGQAWQDQRLDMDVKDAVEQEPVLESLLILLPVGNHFDGTSTKLLQEIQKKAKKYGVDTQSRAWPKGPAQLSRRIGELTELLNKADVTVKIGRQPGGNRYISLSRKKGCDDAGKTPSQTPSIDKSHHPQPLQPSDGCDVKNRLSVFDRLEQLAKTPNERKRS